VLHATWLALPPEKLQSFFAKGATDTSLIKHTFNLHNNLQNIILSIETHMMAVKVWENMIDYRPYTSYGSHYFKCPPVHQTVPV
jgi:hypothetical protein